MKTAILRLSLRRLGEALRLRDGLAVAAVRARFEQPGEVEILIQGGGLACCHGAVPVVSPEEVLDLPGGPDRC